MYAYAYAYAYAFAFAYAYAYAYAYGSEKFIILQNPNEIGTLHVETHMLAVKIKA